MKGRRWRLFFRRRLLTAEQVSGIFALLLSCSATNLVRCLVFVAVCFIAASQLQNPRHPLRDFWFKIVSQSIEIIIIEISPFMFETMAEVKVKLIVSFGSEISESRQALKPSIVHDCFCLSCYP
ncbi:hypothetical protein VNO80_11317 [Phaseolus coccineus]|uniref:Uncharacterized protein n=1 Tax=Phaseolus coccineus TaxID=3886 RepID=A0AAN9NBH2_PHACN